MYPCAASVCLLISLGVVYVSILVNSEGHLEQRCIATLWTEVGERILADTTVEVRLGS